MKELSTMTEKERKYFFEGFRRGQAVTVEIIAVWNSEHDEYEIIGPNGNVVGFADAIEECHEAEQHSRQFSPFEETARAINKHIDSESLWEAFDSGIREGILHDLESLKQHGE